MTPQDFTEVKESLALELEALVPMVIPGLKLEFGVGMGNSIKRIANTWPKETVWGFDSFIGLPEPWVKNADNVKPVGYMTTHGKVPRNSPANVQFVVGFIEDTLAPWWEANRGPISFIHIDTDLYSAARTILETLDDGIVTGTVIRFDDFCTWDEKRAYHNWLDGEWRALHWWMEEYSRDVEPLWRNRKEAGTVRVLPIRAT